MKSRITVSIFSMAIAVLSLSIGGCSGNNSESSDEITQSNISETINDLSNSTTSESSESASGNSEKSSSSGENSESAPSDSQGDAAFLIGLDGKPILASEITKLKNTDKTAETLTKDDLWAEVCCDGFTYLKEPSGIAFNSYRNPEMFDNGEYLGDSAENTNEWKRVYVGDEICGLKVKSASVNFTVNDYEDTWKFPERYLDFGICELEGSIEIEGFLQVLPSSAMYPESSELVEFMPCESKLPITPCQPDSEKGFITPIKEQMLFEHYGDPGIFGELDVMGFGYLSNMTCDMDGIGRGDIAYVRVTLGNIKCAGGGISATLESVERISDILIHDDDSTETRQPAPVKD